MACDSLATTSGGVFGGATMANQLDAQEARKELRHRRNVGKLRDARRRADGKRPQLAVPDVVQGVRGIVEHQLDVAGEQIGDGRRRAPVGHVGDPHAGEDLEPLDREMLRAAGAGRSEIELVRVGLRKAINSGTFATGTFGLATNT